MGNRAILLNDSLDVLEMLDQVPVRVSEMWRGLLKWKKREKVTKPRANFDLIANKFFQT